MTSCINTVTYNTKASK